MDNRDGLHATINQQHVSGMHQNLENSSKAHQKDLAQ